MHHLALLEVMINVTSSGGFERTNQLVFQKVGKITNEIIFNLCFWNFVTTFHNDMKFKMES